MAGSTWRNLGDGTVYGNKGGAGRGLADEDFNPKPAYSVLTRLLHERLTDENRWWEAAVQRGRYLRGRRSGPSAIKWTGGNLDQRDSMFIDHGHSYVPTAPAGRVEVATLAASRI